MEFSIRGVGVGKPSLTFPILWLVCNIGYTTSKEDKVKEGGFPELLTIKQVIYCLKYIETVDHVLTFTLRQL